MTQHRQLRNAEWRLFLSRCQSMQAGNLLKQLNDQNEAIEVQSQHRGDHISIAPCPAKMKHISPEQRERQHDTRKNPNHNSRSECSLGKGKPGHTSENSRHQKDDSSPSKALSFDQSERH